MKRRMITLEQEKYRELLKEFLTHTTILGYSKNGTEIKYANVIEFLMWLEQQRISDIKKVTPAHIKAHHDYLKNRPHKKQEGVLSLKTIHGNMRSIRQLFAMLQAKGDIIVNPMSTLKFTYPQSKKSERKIITIAEVRELYNVTETLQEKAILSLSYGCGLRSMELAAVNVEDVRLNENILIVPRGKGNKRRVIPMSKKVCDDLKNYCEYERPLYIKNENEKSFILNIRGERMRKYTFRKIIKRLTERAGNQNIIRKNISVHNLRHSIATHLLEQGVPIEQVRIFLGHSQLETTEIYTRVNQKQLKTLIR